MVVEEIKNQAKKEKNAIAYYRRELKENKKLTSSDKTSIRKELIKLGAEVRFNTTLTDIKITDNKLSSIILNNTQ